jgi:hypothetical protein
LGTATSRSKTLDQEFGPRPRAGRRRMSVSRSEFWTTIGKGILTNK